MGSISKLARILLSWAGAGVVGSIATIAILGTVPASDVRNAVLLLIWPLLIVCATLITLQWLGRPEENAARNALTAVITAGRTLRVRALADADADEASQAAWKVRLSDWLEQARTVVGNVAPDRLPALQTDPLYTDYPVGDAPGWLKDILLELDVRMEQLVLIRASL